MMLPANARIPQICSALCTSTISSILHILHLISPSFFRKPDWNPWAMSVDTLEPAAAAAPASAADIEERRW